MIRSRGKLTAKGRSGSIAENMDKKGRKRERYKRENDKREQERGETGCQRKNGPICAIVKVKIVISYVYYTK